MILIIREKIRNIIQTLYFNSEYIKIYLIPFALFLLDFSLRAVIGVDIGDTGADMAFLAFATFFSITLDNFDKTGTKNIPIVMLFTLAFILPWLFCLWSISSRHLDSIDFLKITLSILSWIVGMTSLVLSGIIAHQLIEEI